MCGTQPFSCVGSKVRFQQGWCDFHMGLSTGFTCKNGNFDGSIWEYDSKLWFFWVPRLQTDPYNPSIILLFSSIFLFKRPKFRHLGRGSLPRFVPVGTAHQRPACLAGMVSCLVPIPSQVLCSWVDYTTAIDIWSIGCIFAEAPGWAFLGDGV